MKACTSTSVTVEGLCIQTSQVRSKPHKLWFQFYSNGVIKGHCTCKAGNSAQCKHMLAMLLSVHRSGIENLEQLTSTDLKQAWGKLKSMPLYEPRRTRDLCHVQGAPRLHLDSGKLDEIRNKMIAVAPNSTLALHSKGRCSFTHDSAQEPSMENAKPNVISPICRVLFQHMDLCQQVRTYEELQFHGVAFKDATTLKIYKVAKEHLAPPVYRFYLTHTAVTQEEAVEICSSTVSQNDTKWHRQRMLRITGSKCHSLYRFLPTKECTWDQKILKYLTKTFKGNDATRYGKSCERPATEEYTRKSGNEVTALGFVINPVIPWLGFSPDGVVFKNGQPSVLLEVKSPVRGKHAKICELIKEKKLPYIISDRENFSLRITHSYFSQVQLGLFLLNLQVAHFIVYSQVESLMICVKRDDHFIDNLVRRLQYVYFEHLLPQLAKYEK
ncbi:uncharacterized protein [Dermacentor albipictus]|uniref:uncharacterized protein n=1 Tax=Dermacentor albipictus TaxID=60249 RepID=UPI0038FCAEDF